MEHLSKVSNKILEDLLKSHQKAQSYKKIKEYSAYFLGASALIIYGSIYFTKNVSVVFTNPFITLFLYGGVISSIVLAGSNIYSKGPKEKAENLRLNLIKKLEDEKDICNTCSGKCIHKEKLIEEMERTHGINLYY